MRRTVTWDPAASDELLRLWLQESNKRNAITIASHRIEQMLRFGATIYGQPSGSDRTLTVAPLSVLYTVSDADMLVTVWQVTWAPTSP